MKNTSTFLILGIVLAGAVGCAAGYLFYSRSPAAPPPVPEPVVVGTTPFEVSGLIFIAEDQGYFEKNGISPTIRIYDAGVNAMDALYAGDVDVATAADFVFARHVLAGNRIRGFATLGETEFHYIISQKNGGIRNISGLKGKRIGVARGTSGDFFLGRFLELQGIDLNEVGIVDLPPALVADPLLNGSVDAVSTWDPYAWTTEMRLGDNAQVWPEQKGQMMYWVAICREDYLAGNRTRVTKFLNSLRQAEAFAVDHPEEARAIVQKRLHTDDAYIRRVWPATRLSLTLDQSLVTAMEDESRWMIANNLTDAKALPDLRHYIDTEGLEQVRPGSVHIIGRS